ncbi:hypothetical protein JOB18_033253 [Solea senegalensis]|uniref:Uncharacterized protein n=1 Tax=Solea senegalensis TaxID=28829 RepID=A0AAV6S2I6_SOLSE|nr:hypothetical protein JOB18_033253 [Solea senegalensis]
MRRGPCQMTTGHVVFYGCQIMKDLKYELFDHSERRRRSEHGDKEQEDSTVYRMRAQMQTVNCSDLKLK